jgi:fluoroacetyl-CoA thioesterase
MKNPFLPGDQKHFETLVTEEKLARFDSGLVHPVYSTFALGKDVEWACRLFVLEMKEEGEEGVGAALSIEHLYPAPLGSIVRIEATLVSVIGKEIICTYEAFANGFKIANGHQSQKIINKARFDQLLQGIEIQTKSDQDQA